MKKLALAINLLIILSLIGLLAACGGDEAENPKQSVEAKAVTDEVGGPFSAAEFKKFLKDLPSIPGLTAASQKAMKTDALDSETRSAMVQSAIQALDWDENRFMYIYSHSISVMNVEQMTRAKAQMDTQMEKMSKAQQELMKQMVDDRMGNEMAALKAEVDKEVPASEQAIIHDNIEGLYAALGIPRQE